MPSMQTSHPCAISPIPVPPTVHCRMPSRTIRRRPTQEQGRALEILAHAIEYLTDSELHTGEGEFSNDVLCATGILMDRSRAVFAECPEVLPLGQTFRQGLIRMFGRPAMMVAPGGSGDLRADTLAR